MAQKETTDEGQAITFTDETFNGILYKDKTAPEPGTSLIIFYTVDGTKLLSGKRYKRMFTTADPGKYEYYLAQVSPRLARLYEYERKIKSLLGNRTLRINRKGGKK